MVVVIGATAVRVAGFLSEKGIEAFAYQSAQVPSLTALLLQKPEISDIVLLQGEERTWSMGHILAAAKQLQNKGRMIFLGDYGPLPALITVAADNEMLLKLLKKQKISDGTTGAKTPVVPLEMPENHKRQIVIRPMVVPPEKILLLGVIGSQHRIGCTTQAVGLWHYCKALGFDPAIVASDSEIQEIARPMRSQGIPGGYQIEGIPFVTDTAHAYDCYILDIGPGNVQEALRATDCLVLIAGSKPWELQYTAAALRAARGKEMLVLLSFSSRSDAAALQPLFGCQTAEVLPWMPDLWKPSVEALEVYESVLRPALEKMLARDETQQENESQPPRN